MPHFLISIHCPTGYNPAHIDEAIAWGRKATVACRAPVEVRPFH